MGERRTSIGESAQQGITVRNRFVARDGQAAAQTAGGRNCSGQHGHVCRILRDVGQMVPCLDFTDEMVLIECRVAHR